MAISATTTTTGWQLHVESEPIEVTSMMRTSEPDPEWFERDDHAHEHTHETRGETWDGVTGTYWCADCREHHETIEQYVCLICRDEITPHWIQHPPSPYRSFMPGPISAYAIDPDGHEHHLSREDVEELRRVGIEWLPELIASR